VTPDVDSLVDRARALTHDRRALLGICGAPGAGKSTLADVVVAAFGREAVVVPMDGFHLHDDVLAEVGLSDRKGAPETFDVSGYVALLRRLRNEADRVVYAPEFDRSRELALAAAIAVRPEHRLVITEGNYLLHDAERWCDVRPLLDEVWFVQTDDDVRVQQLVARHVRHGRSPQEAHEWVLRSDERNAELVARTSGTADLRVTLP
jgi:pantothenate kinase